MSVAQPWFDRAMELGNGTAASWLSEIYGEQGELVNEVLAREYSEKALSMMGPNGGGDPPSWPTLRTATADGQIRLAFSLASG